jgi:aryl-alcohol dehydrogenase-like predicted oxidoreductase
MQNELVLGCAQFGSSYGIASEGVLCSAEISHQILDECLNIGLTLIDTSSNYGISELIIGTYTRRQHLRCNTKINIRKPDGSLKPHGLIRSSIETCLSKLSVSSINCMFIHDIYNPSEIDEGVLDVLEVIDSHPDVEQVGLSLYGTDGIQNIPIIRGSAIQAPGNWFNLRCLADLGCKHIVDQHTLYFRGILLQGLLVQHQDRIRKLDIPNGLAKSLIEYHKRGQISGYNKLELALLFAKMLPHASKLIFGVVSPEQLIELVEAYENSKSIDTKRINELGLLCYDNDDSDPRYW